MRKKQVITFKHRVLSRKGLVILGAIFCLLIAGTLFVFAKNSHHTKSDSQPTAQQAPAKEPVANQDVTSEPTPKADTPETKPVTKPATVQSSPAPAPEPVKNPYQVGFSSWYVFNRRTEVGKPVGTTWMNEKAWAYYAQRDGYIVNKNPEKYAMTYKSNGFLGFVESVNTDGTLTLSCMNCLSGWNRTDQMQVPQTEIESYEFIH